MEAKAGVMDVDLDFGTAGHLVTARSPGLLLQTWARSLLEAKEIARALAFEAPDWDIEIEGLDGADLVTQ
jgi:hypothetical protein